MHLPKRYSTAVSPLFHLLHITSFWKHPLPLSYGGFQMPAWILYARRNRQTSAYLSPRLAPSFYDKLDSGINVWKYALCSRTLYPGKHKAFPVFHLLKEVSLSTLWTDFICQIIMTERSCSILNLLHAYRLFQPAWRLSSNSVRGTSPNCWARYSARLIFAWLAFFIAPVGGHQLNNRSQILRFIAVKTG